MLVGLICMTIVFLFSFVIRKFIGCDKRCMYINEKDLPRFKDRDKLEETEKEFFVL